ncbi:hypothetical protein GPALN_013468, partial [Globodera pallida]
MGQEYEKSPIRRSAEGAQRRTLEEKAEDARRMLDHALEHHSPDQQTYLVTCAGPWVISSIQHRAIADK